MKLVVKISSRLHATLIAVTTGEPRKIGKSVPRGDGLRAWNELVKYYDPRSISDKPSEHSKITNPVKKAKDYTEAIILLNEWLNDINIYESKYVIISQETKMALLTILMRPKHPMML